MRRKRDLECSSEMTIPQYSFKIWIAVIVCFSPTLVYSWGKTGHELVGEIAYHRLSAKAQSAVCSLLGYTHSHTHKTNSSQSAWSPLANVSDWADVIKYHAKWSSPLHYVDVQEDAYADHCRARPPYETDNDDDDDDEDNCRFVYERDCAGDVCVVGAIANYTTRLHRALHTFDFPDATLQEQPARKLRGSTNRQLHTPPTPLQDLQDPCCTGSPKESLMFLTHFVGDVHQPLHVSRSHDRGGNSIHVTFPTSSSRTKQTNLHQVWDDEIIYRVLKEQFDSDPFLLDKHLQSELLPHGLYGKEAVQWASNSCLHDRGVDNVHANVNVNVNVNVSCVATWAQESLAYALHTAYFAGDIAINLPGSTFHNHKAALNDNDDKMGAEEEWDVQDGDELSEAYYETRWPIVMRRLVMGGVRLAALLEGVLGEGLIQEENEVGIIW